MLIKLRHCSEVDKEQTLSRRQYAHTNHYDNTICVADAFWDLPMKFQVGLLAHELGHIIMLEKRQTHYEPDADKAAKQYLGVTVQYVAHTPWGEDLQYLNKRDLTRFRSKVSFDPKRNTITFYP